LTDTVTVACRISISTLAGTPWATTKFGPTLYNLFWGGASLRDGVTIA
jgi:hypothetical protein